MAGWKDAEMVESTMPPTEPTDEPKPRWMSAPIVERAEVSAATSEAPKPRWMEAPIVDEPPSGEPTASTPRWKQAPVVEDGATSSQDTSLPDGFTLLATTKDGGRILSDKDGNKSFTSPNYSTTDPERIAAIMEGATPAEAYRSGMNQDIIDQNPVAARLTKFVEGTPFIGSYLDEGIGAIAGDDAASAVRATSQAMSEENPTESLALSLGGGITGGVGLGAAVLPKVAPMIPGSALMKATLSSIAGATTGAVEGTIYGAGDQSGEGRLENAEKGAVFGAGLGAFFGGAGSFAADGVEAFAKRYKKLDLSTISHEFGLSRPAARAFKNALAGEDLTKARKILTELGDEAMLADAGPAAGAMLDAVSQAGGQAKRISQDAVEGRLSRMAPKLQETFDKTFGKPTGRRAVHKDIAQKSAAARKEAYDRAMSSPIDYASDKGRSVEAVLERVPPKTLQSAISEANEAMIAEGKKNMQIVAEIADDGAVTFKEMPNVQQLDEVKKALQGIAQSETDALTGKISAKGRRAKNLSRSLRDAMTEAVPSYKRALRLGGDKISEEEAFRMGERLFTPNTTIEDVADMMSDATKETQKAAKLGVRQFVENSVSHVRRTITDGNTDAREAMAAIKMFSSRANREKLSRILGEEDAREVFKSIDQITQAFELRAMMAQNSKTAVRQAIQDEVKDVVSPNAVEALASGDIIGSGQKVVSFLTGAGRNLPEERKTKVFEEIATALTQKRGPEAERALILVQKAMEGQPLKDADALAIARMVNPVAISGDQYGREQLAR